MKLSDLIIEHRKKMDISQREFSRRCELSNTYISFIENGVNPKTGRPIVPTLEQYGKIANGMNISVQRLFELLDEDAPVSLSVPDESSHVVINNIDQFSHLLQYMTPEEYDFVITAFDKAHKRMIEKGVEL